MGLRRFSNLYAVGTKNRQIIDTHRSRSRKKPPTERLGLLLFRSPQLAIYFVMSNHKLDVRYWHSADIPAAAAFVRYWSNSGQRVALGLNRYAAIAMRREYDVEPLRSSFGANLCYRGICTPCEDN
jgi:hypothetical protein